MLAVSNLDFEWELAEGPRPRTRAAQKSGQSNRWQHILRLLPEARQALTGDLETLLEQPSAAPAEVDRLVCWGVTPRLLELARRVAPRQPFPSLQAVRAANDKRSSHQLEQELGLALPGSQLVSSLAQFELAVAQCPHDWVLKHPFGFSALERAVGRRGRITPSALGWARNRLQQGWTLLFEPWVEGARSYSTHFELTPEGDCRWLGHCALLTDAGGVYRGNRVGTAQPLPAEAQRVGQAICGRLAELGYWGPVGIDGLDGCLDGRPLQRPLVEVNARCSFGRLTLALRHWLPADWPYLWWFPPASWEGLSATPDPLPEPGEGPPLLAGYYSLPRSVDPDSCSRTVVVTAPGTAELSALETTLGVGVTAETPPPRPESEEDRR